MLFFFKQKTAYEMRISDWSSDVCSSDLGERELGHAGTLFGVERARTDRDDALRPELEEEDDEEQGQHLREADIDEDLAERHEQPDHKRRDRRADHRTEPAEHDDQESSHDKTLADMRGDRYHHRPATR